jgi:NTE family protein
MPPALVTQTAHGARRFAATPGPQPVPERPAAGARPPRLALVLGSGGVRSIAALGMFDVLQQRALAPDLIVGCSAGALFGALMAAGHPAAQAVQIATRLWSPDVTRQRRWRAIGQMLFPRLGRFSADFSLRDDSRVMDRLHKAFGDMHFEDLRVTLRVAATDAATGERVIVSRGPLVPALRASIALPFMFAPVHLDGRRLVDGFVSDPLPVEAADDARVVVALGLAAPMPSRVDGPSRMLAQVTSALTNNLVQARLAAARARGTRLLQIQPRLDRRVGLFDTAAMPDLVQAGREATLSVLPQLQDLLAEPAWPAAA